MSENKNWLQWITEGIIASGAVFVGVPLLFHWLVRRSSGRDEIEKRIDKLENQLGGVTNRVEGRDVTVLTSDHENPDHSPKKTIIQPMSEGEMMKSGRQIRNVM